MRFRWRRRWVLAGAVALALGACGTNSRVRRGIGIDATTSDAGKNTQDSAAADATGATDGQASGNGRRKRGATDGGMDGAGGSSGDSGALAAKCTVNDPERMVFFGDVHVHTGFSTDAYKWGTRLNPDDAYAFAQGKAVTVPVGVDGTPTTITIDRPLDFMAVTDHAELLSAEAGNVDEATPPAPDTAREAWMRTIEAANRALDPPPSCRFTSFIGYEWSGSPPMSTPSSDSVFDFRRQYVWYHRNVIFGTDYVPEVPINAYDVPLPDDLFTRLRTTCKDLSGNLCDVITIPHNSNYSQGTSFAFEDTLTAEQAKAYAEIEPLTEIQQVKGNSECKYGVDNNDPYCNFETLGQPICNGQNSGACESVCGDPNAPLGVRCEEPLSYVRNALKSGVAIERRIGENPLKLGIIAGTDNHNGLGGSAAEDAYIGAHGADDRDAQDRLDVYPQLNPGGLAAVWAEENSRSSLFAALKRRETYGTSGPRMIVRFFGGWQFPNSMCDRADLVGRGYADGVPMGGDLPPRPSGAKAPQFVVWAARDLGTASRPGTLLQQLQIIKGWVDGAGVTHEKVYVVAGDPQNHATVDTSTCEQSGPGAEELCDLWTDPEYVADQHAFYYARVLENPSCRYSAYDCARLAKKDRPPSCTDGSIPLAIQERAWTSPIWTRP